MRQILGRQLQFLEVSADDGSRRTRLDELTIKAWRFMISRPRTGSSLILSTAMTQTRWLDSRPVKADLGKKAGFDFSG